MKKIKYLITIIKIFLNTKKIYQTPMNKKIINFDSYTNKQVKKIFNPDDLFEICCHGERREFDFIYLSPKILLLTLVEFFKGNLSCCYYIALIRAVKPKVILTFAPFNFAFIKISKALRKKFNFITVQPSVTLLNHLSKDAIKKVYIQKFLCINKQTVDHYKLFDVKVDQFDIIGSTQLALAEEYFKNDNLKKNEDNPYVCVLSGNTHLNSNNVTSAIKKKLLERHVTLWTNIDKFSKKHNIYFKLASKRPIDFDPSDKYGKEDYDEEKKLFNQIVKDNKYFIKTDRYKEKFSNYKLALNSSLVIGYGSTLLLESLAKKKKILDICIEKYNEHPDIASLMPEDNISSLFKPSYEELESRILKLLKMPQSEYDREMHYKRNYMIAYDPKVSALEKLKKHVNLILEKN